MTLSPSTRASFAETAAIKATEAARLFEAAGLFGLAHDMDEAARKANAWAAEIDAREASDIAQSEAASNAWEATHGRAFDQAVRGMPTDQLQRIMGAI